MIQLKNIFTLALLTFCLIALSSCSGSKVQKNKNDVLNRMELAMGELPSLKKLPPFNTKITDSLEANGYTRYQIHFTVAPGEVLPALLYMPHMPDDKKKLPAMLVLHSTDATGKMVLSGSSPKPDRAFAIELAEGGYIVIAPDYPDFGEMKNYDFKNDRYESGTIKGIFNHIRCVDYLQSLPEVDSSRIGVLGHSLGGHNAIFTSAFDKRLKVTVSSCGWTKFDYYDAGDAVTQKHGGKLGPWAQERYMPYVKTKYNLDPKLIPFDFDEVIASLAPRAFFTNSPLYDANFSIDGVKEGMKKILVAYKNLNASKNLIAVYPDAKHDFPKDIRLQAYRFIDSVLQHTPKTHTLHR